MSDDPLESYPSYVSRRDRRNNGDDDRENDGTNKETDKEREERREQLLQPDNLQVIISFPINLSICNIDCINIWFWLT